MCMCMHAFAWVMWRGQVWPGCCNIIKLSQCFHGDSIVTVFLSGECLLPGSHIRQGAFETELYDHFCLHNAVEPHL